MKRSTFLRLNRSSLRGITLIEVIIAGALAAVGLFVVYLGFLDASRLSVRNDLTSVALNVLNTKVDSDSRLDYDDPALAAGTTETTIAELPQGKITRVIEDPRDASAPPIKKLTYYLQWETSSGPQTIHLEHELTPEGLAND